MRISDWSSDVCSSDHIARHVLDRLEAGQRVRAVDVHRAGAADALAARPAEGQAGVDVVLDVDDRVQHHRAAAVQIDGVALQPRVLAGVGAPAADLEGGSDERGRGEGGVRPCGTRWSRDYYKKNA